MDPSSNATHLCSNPRHSSMELAMAPTRYYTPYLCRAKVIHKLLLRLCYRRLTETITWHEQACEMSCQQSFMRFMDTPLALPRS